MASWFDRLQFGRKQQQEFISCYMSFRDGDGHIGDRDILEGLIDTFREDYGDSHIITRVSIDIMHTFSSGQSLSVALQKWFSVEVVQIFDAVYKTTGDYAMVEELFSRLDRGRDAVIKLLLAQVLPMYILGVAILIDKIVGGQMLPFLASRMPIEDIGGFSVALTNIVAFGDSYGLPLLAFIISLIVVSVVSLPYWVGESRTSFDCYSPIHFVYSKLVGYKLFGLLSMLVSNGKPMREALEIVVACSTPYQAWHVNLLLDATSAGYQNTNSKDTGNELADNESMQILLPKRLNVRLNVARRRGISDPAKLFNLIAQKAVEDFESSLVKPRLLIQGILFLVGLGLIVTGLMSLMEMQTQMQNIQG